jgi:hypothetical protein
MNKTGASNTLLVLNIWQGTNANEQLKSIYPSRQ